MLQIASSRSPAFRTISSGTYSSYSSSEKPASEVAHCLDAGTDNRRSRFAVDLAAALPELLGFLAQSLGEDDRLRGDAMLRGVLAHLLRDLHRAELRPAHRAEVRDLGALRWQRLVVKLARGLGIQREVELILPAELEARLADRVVPLARARVAFGDIGGVRSDLVGDHAVLDVLAVGQAQVLLRGDVAQ